MKKIHTFSFEYNQNITIFFYTIGMRKKVVKKPKPIGYAMLEKCGESNYVCLYDNTGFDAVFKSARTHIENHDEKDIINYDWQIVGYSDSSAWKDNEQYDSIILKIEGKKVKEYDIVETYLAAFGIRERDSLLLNTLEKQVTEICKKYKEDDVIEWRQVLQLGTLKDMYRSIKTNDFMSYQNIYLDIDTKAKESFS